jgi:hypothetical protein
MVSKRIELLDDFFTPGKSSVTAGASTLTAELYLKHQPCVESIFLEMSRLVIITENYC